MHQFFGLSPFFKVTKQQLNVINGKVLIGMWLEYLEELEVIQNRMQQKRSKSVQEYRIALYKSDQQQTTGTLIPKKPDGFCGCKAL